MQSGPWALFGSQTSSSMEFWVAFGPICLGVAGYFLVSELGRIRKEIHDLRQTTTQTSIDIASIKEAMRNK